MKINKKNSFSFRVLSSVSEDNIKQLYEIHLESLPNDIIHHFGYNLVRRYILRLIKKKDCKIIIALSKESIVGFIILRFKEFNIKKLLDFQSILKFFFKSIFNPMLILRLFYQLNYTIKIPKQSCEIDYFAVSKNFKSIGIGKKLVKIAEKEARKKKFKKIFTKTYNKNLAYYYMNKKKSVLLDKYKIFNYLYFCVYWKIN